MHLFNRSLLPLIGAVFVFACGDDDETEINVASRANPNVRLTDYRTFALATTDQLSADVRSRIPSNVQANINYVQEQVRDQLIQKGLTEVPLSASPLMIVTTLARTETDTGVQYTCVPGAFWYSYWYYTWDPCAWLETDIVSIGAGAVVVALVDQTRQLVTYGGIMTGTSIDDEPEDIKEAVDEGIERMFENYPNLPETP